MILVHRTARRLHCGGKFVAHLRENSRCKSGVRLLNGIAAAA
jgi:hypothetical protein